jgi:cytidylate kinase
MKSFRQGGPESYVGEGPEFGVDRDTLQQFTANVIEGAAKESHCVIIGRSAQCVLQTHPLVLHVLVYGPLAEKVVRMKHRHPGECNLPALLHRIDSERSRYTKSYYGRDWSDRGLYHLCVNSTLGIDACADLIVQTIQSSVQSVNESDFRRDQREIDVIRKS